MQDLTSSVIQGFPIGCVFALVAMGFVLTYKVSGVFNLAFGAQAYAAAAVYYELRVKHGWPTPAAAVVAVLVFSPLLGVLLYFAIYRYLRPGDGASPVVAAYLRAHPAAAIESRTIHEHRLQPAGE